MNAYQAYATVGGISAASSFLLGWGSIKTLNTITDQGMWAIALMSFAPAILGMGVSLFICLSHRAEPRERRPPADPYDAGAFRSSDR